MAHANSSISHRTTDEGIYGSTPYSSNSSSCLPKRKLPNPLAKGPNPYKTSINMRNTGKEVRQRVMSAKLLKLRTLQSQLSDANFQIAELMRENQALKTLQKRQDKALTKYEGQKADLPKIMQSYEGEIHTLTERNKALKKNIKDLNDQLKVKNDEINSLHSRIKHYEQLDKDKRLLEREKLVEQVEDLKQKLQKSDEEIVLLNRKLTLETKTNKQKLNAESAKFKQCNKELMQALEEINRLNRSLESRESSTTSLTSKSKLNKSPLVAALDNIKSLSSESNIDLKMPVTEVKLEPIQGTKNDNSKDIKNILKSPVDNIKNRLSSVKISADEVKLHSPKDNVKSNQGSTVKFEKMIKEIPPVSQDENEDLLDELNFERVEQLTKNCQEKFKKEENGMCRKVGDYCVQALNTVKVCNNTIANHRANYEFSLKNTEQILQSVKRIDVLEEKLKSSADLLSSLDDDDVDGEKKEAPVDKVTLASKIVIDELEFQDKHGSKDKIEKSDKPELKVSLDKKKKLLATLRAIDEIGDIDGFVDDNRSKRNARFMDLLTDGGD